MWPLIICFHRPRGQRLRLRTLHNVNLHGNTILWTRSRCRRQYYAAVFGRSYVPRISSLPPFNTHAERLTEVSVGAKKCGFAIVSVRGTQLGRWLDIWETATAVRGMCGRKGEVGTGDAGCKSSATLLLCLWGYWMLIDLIKLQITAKD